MKNTSLEDLWRSKKQAMSEAEKILDRAETRGRDLTRSEADEFDELYEEIKQYENAIGEKLTGGDDGPQAGRRAFQGVNAGSDRLDGLRAPSVHTEKRGSAMNRDNDSIRNDETRERLTEFALTGRAGDEPETREATQSIGTAAEGGVFASTILAQDFLRIQQQFGGVRDTRARVIRTETGESMKRPFVDDVDETAEQVAENSTVSNVNRVDMGSVQFEAHTFDSGVVTLSREQIQDSRQDVANIITRSLAQRIGRTVEPDLAGSTVTTSTAINGIITLTTGSESIAAGSSNLSMQNLRNLYFSVDPVYRQNAEWAVSDSAMAALADLEDSDGDPLITDNWRQGEPPQLMGKPIRKVIGLGDIGTSTEFPILFGDFRQGYAVRDVLNVEIVRYNEHFMPSRRIGFQAFQRVDGRPVLSSTVSSTNRPYRGLRTT